MRLVAPMLFIVAMTLRRLSMKVDDRVRHADAADQQRRQPDEGEELAQALERAADLRRGIAPVDDGEAQFGQLGRDARAQGFELLGPGGARILELQGVAPADQRSGLHEARLFQCRIRDQDARSVGQAVGDAVGLRPDGAGDLDRVGAEHHAVADFEPQPLQQDRVDDGARAQRLLQDCAVAQHDLADERVEAIDDLELGQRLVGSIRAARHGAHGRRLAQAAEACQMRAFSTLRARVHARQRQVAAEDRLALALETGAQRVRYRADAGDDRHAQRHTRDENTKSGKAAAQLAQGDAEQDGEPPLAIARGRRERFGRCHDASASAACSMRPSDMWIVR